LNIKDIAKKANVSITTVSRILNHDESFSVTDDTRKLVLSIAAEFNYKSKRKNNIQPKVNSVHKVDGIKNIGLLLSVTQQEEFNDTYFLSIREGIEKQAAESDINISTVIRLNGNNSNPTLDHVDGLIVVGHIDSENLTDIFHQTNNIVFVDHAPQHGEFDSVICNLEKATENVLDYLFELGHQQIGFIGGRKKSKNISTLVHTVEIEEERRRAYERVMRAKGTFNSKDIYIGDWNAAAGYELMKKAIGAGHLPSAFIVGSDPMSIGALRALNEANIKIPEDVAIVSFDDIKTAAYLQPTLTTVKIYTEEMGRMAVKVLSERLNHRDIPIKIVIPTKLIVRDSCGGKPNHEHCKYIL